MKNKDYAERLEMDAVKRGHVAFSSDIEAAEKWSFETKTYENELSENESPENEPPENQRYQNEFCPGKSSNTKALPDLANETWIQIIQEALRYNDEIILFASESGAKQYFNKPKRLLPTHLLRLSRFFLKEGRRTLYGNDRFKICEPAGNWNSYNFERFLSQIGPESRNEMRTLTYSWPMVTFGKKVDMKFFKELPPTRLPKLRTVSLESAPKTRQDIDDVLYQLEPILESMAAGGIADFSIDYINRSAVYTFRDKPMTELTSVEDVERCLKAKGWFCENIVEIAGRKPARRHGFLVRRITFGGKVEKVERMSQEGSLYQLHCFL